jgi:hypothetical protein
MHAISIHDVATDTVHQFAPTYRDYVLYSDSNNPDDTKEPPKTYRAKTFVPVGQVRACLAPDLSGPPHSCVGSARLCWRIVLWNIQTMAESERSWRWVSVVPASVLGRLAHRIHRYTMVAAAPGVGLRAFFQKP